MSDATSLDGADNGGFEIGDWVVGNHLFSQRRFIGKIIKFGHSGQCMIEESTGVKCWVLPLYLTTNPEPEQSKVAYDFKVGDVVEGMPPGTSRIIRGTVHKIDGFEIVVIEAGRSSGNPWHFCTSRNDLRHVKVAAAPEVAAPDADTHKTKEEKCVEWFKEMPLNDPAAITMAIRLIIASDDMPLKNVQEITSWSLAVERRKSDENKNPAIK